MRRFLSQLRWLIERRRKEAELRDELEFHLGEDADERTAAGLPEEAARLAARRVLGNRALIEEDTRASWGWTWIERAAQDVRYAVRMVRRRPGFTVAAVVTLMLGIGANTAVFSLLHGLLLKTLPVERPEELVRLVEQGPDPSSYRDAFTPVTRDTLARGTTALSGVIASSTSFSRPRDIEERGEKQQVFLQMVSDNYFDVLGVRAFRGRVLREPAPGVPGEAVAVISEEYWRRHYGGDLSALGARFRLRAREFTVVGIAAPGFRGIELDVPADVWLPFEQVVPPGDEERVRGRSIRVMGRLQPGATLARAEAESTAILGRAVKLQAGGTGYSALRRRLSQPLLLVGFVVALVLLITCADLANLMLATTAARERELAVRGALGTSRGRLVRQLLTESLVLSAAGGVLAVGFAYWISAKLLGFLSPEQALALPNLQFGLDVRVLGFAALLSGATCVLFGLVPALRASRTKGAAGSGQAWAPDSGAEAG